MIHFGLLNRIPSEEADVKYRRLIRLPQARQAIRQHNELMIVTSYGELMLVSNNYPTGTLINCPFSIEKIWKSDPWTILDTSGTLRFGSIHKNVLGTVSRTKIRDVIQMTAYYHEGSAQELMIKTTEGSIRDTPGNISEGNYEFSDIKFDIIGNCYTYYENGKRFINSIIRGFQVDDNVIDAVLSEGPLFLINSDRELKVIFEGGSTDVTTDFIPTRLFKSIYDEQTYVEDDGGNIYSIRKLINPSNPDQPRELDLPVVLYGFRMRGQMIKPAGRFPPLHKK